MTDDIVEYQRKMKAFRETELGSLFEKFVNLHATAWQLDERSSWNDQDIIADKAWKQLEPVQKELRSKLMQIAGVE